MAWQANLDLVRCVTIVFDEFVIISFENVNLFSITNAPANCASIKLALIPIGAMYEAVGVVCHIPFNVGKIADLCIDAIQLYNSCMSNN